MSCRAALRQAAAAFSLSRPAMARAKSCASNGLKSSMPSPTPMATIGKVKALGDGDQNAAARRAVELGHDQAGHAGDLLEDLHLVQRVLTRGGVEHEQHAVRRAVGSSFFSTRTILASSAIRSDLFCSRPPCR